MNFFGSILKSDQLTQTGRFGKELPWFLRSSLSIHALLSAWEEVLQCGPICGLSEYEGHIPPERLLRGGRIKVDSLCPRSCLRSEILHPQRCLSLTPLILVLSICSLPIALVSSLCQVKPLHLGLLVVASNID